MNSVTALVASILLGVFGQISLKAGAVRASNLGSVYLHKFTLLGLVFYFLAALFYIFALKKIPLSIAFPSVSISYVAVAFLAHLIWGEPFGFRQILALLLIGLGIYLLSRS